MTQGNILSPFKRSFATHLFVEFESGDIQAPLQELLTEYVTPADRQQELWEQFRSTGESEGMAMFGISGSGAEHLGVTAKIPQAASMGPRLFTRGMQAVDRWDASVRFWEPAYRKRIDAFLMFADHDNDRLDVTVSDFLRKGTGILKEVTRQKARSLRRDINGKNRGYEHFGFRDDVSKGVNPALVLVQEGPTQSPALGCFAVMMKIQQHLDRFEHARQALAAEAERAGAYLTPEQAGEKCIGRTSSGEPLVPRGDDPDTFTFTRGDGAGCPIHAHIRSMNKRDGRGAPIIVRRGMSYGPTTQELANGAPQEDSGLMFLSFHRSLLEFLNLMMNAEYLRDPLLSHTADWSTEFSPPTGCVKGRRPGQKWSLSGRTVCYPMADLTTRRGGEFFYIPSIPFIQSLAT